MPGSGPKGGSEIYAIIRTGGRQYRVEQDQLIDVDRLSAEVGSTLDLGEVLLLASNGDVRVGQPTVDGARVVAEVIEHGRDAKIVVFKYKAKTRYRRRRGHRQGYTRLAVRQILTAEAPPEAEAKPKRRRAAKAKVEAEAKPKRPAAAKAEAEAKPARRTRARKADAETSTVEAPPVEAPPAEEKPARKPRARKARAEKPDTAGAKPARRTRKPAGSQGTPRTSARKSSPESE